MGFPGPAAFTEYVAYFYDEYQNRLAGPLVIPERLSIYRRPVLSALTQWTPGPVDPQEMAPQLEQFDLIESRSSAALLYYQRRRT